MQSVVDPSLAAITPDQIGELGAALAKEIIDKVLQPQQKQLRTVVVMEALMLLYRFHAQSLPPEAMGLCSMALADVAGDLLKASATPQTAPAGAAIH